MNPPNGSENRKEDDRGDPRTDVAVVPLEDARLPARQRHREDLSRAEQDVAGPLRNESDSLAAGDDAAVQQRAIGLHDDVVRLCRLGCGWN
jgi:hypothetical protein